MIRNGVSTDKPCDGSCGKQHMGMATEPCDNEDYVNGPYHTCSNFSKCTKKHLGAKEHLAKHGESRLKSLARFLQSKEQRPMWVKNQLNRSSVVESTEQVHERGRWSISPAEPRNYSPRSPSYPPRSRSRSRSRSPRSPSLVPRVHRGRQQHRRQVWASSEPGDEEPNSAESGQESTGYCPRSMSYAEPSPRYMPESPVPPSYVAVAPPPTPASKWGRNIPPGLPTSPSYSPTTPIDEGHSDTMAATPTSPSYSPTTPISIDMSILIDDCISLSSVGVQEVAPLPATGVPEEMEQASLQQQPRDQQGEGNTALFLLAPEEEAGAGIQEPVDEDEVQTPWARKIIGPMAPWGHESHETDEVKRRRAKYPWGTPDPEQPRWFFMGPPDWCSEYKPRRTHGTAMVQTAAVASEWGTAQQPTMPPAAEREAGDGYFEVLSDPTGDPVWDEINRGNQCNMVTPAESSEEEEPKGCGVMPRRGSWVRGAVLTESTSSSGTFAGTPQSSPASEWEQGRFEVTPSNIVTEPRCRIKTQLDAIDLERIEMMIGEVPDEEWHAAMIDPFVSSDSVTATASDGSD